MQAALLLPVYTVHVNWLSHISLGTLLRRRCPMVLAELSVENLLGAVMLAWYSHRMVQRWTRKVPQKQQPWATVRTPKRELIGTFGALTVTYLLSAYASSAAELLMCVATGMGATWFNEGRRCAVQAQGWQRPAKVRKRDAAGVGLIPGAAEREQPGVAAEQLDPERALLRRPQGHGGTGAQVDAGLQ